MAYGKSIELFLVNGTADSLTIAELSNWNGKAIKIPRIEVSSCYREDITQAGVYFLFCKEDDGTDSVYIGEAENLQKGMTTGGGKLRMSKSAAVSTEINLIGMTVDEAIAHLDKYLDDAYLAHVPNVRIVHGKGTGALRTAVHQYLKRCKHVKSFRLGTFGEGDAGVTIAEFK